MCLVVAAFQLASWFRLDLISGKLENMASLSSKTVWLSIVYSIVLCLILSIFGFYNTTRTRQLSWKIRTILLSTTLSVLIASTFFYLFRLVDFSRGVLFVFYLLMNIFLIGKYSFMRLILSRYRGQGYNLKHVVVVGTGDLALQYQEDIAAEPELGFHIKGFVGKENAAEPYLGPFEVLDEELDDANEAVIALTPSEYENITDIIAVCEKNGVKYSVIPFYNNIIPSNPVIDTIGHSKLINMRTNKLENLGWQILKRGFDIFVSAVCLIVLAPLMALIAIGVKISSPGPVLFKQTRVGYEKKEFQMLKFRSMRVNQSEDTAWTTNEDERRTRFGSFIRKTSLDELPQLFNVLKGDMSLIGPRPELPYFVEQFKETIPLYMVKHQVKPGMTGWAQVNGYRGDTSIEKRIELDLWYIENWSVFLDLKIMLMTIFGGMVNKESV